MTLSTKVVENYKIFSPEKLENDLKDTKTD